MCEWLCNVKVKCFQVMSWEIGNRWHSLSTTAKQVAMLWPCAAKEEMYGVLLPVKHLFYPSTSYGPCLSVSICHKWEFCWNSWMNWAGFDVGASFHLSYTMLKRNSGIFKIRVLSSRILSRTPAVENFASAYRLSNVLSTYLNKDGRSEHDKLDQLSVS